MSRSSRPHANQSGQAVIEYILILAITVILIGTFLYRFSTAFKVYANDFFGGYVACLLETGELPGNAACGAEYKAFSIANGTTSPGTGGTGSGGGGGGGSGGGGTGSGGGTGGTSGSGSSGSNGKNGSSGKGKNGSKSGSASDSGTGSSGSKSSNSSGYTGAETGLSGAGGGGGGSGRFGRNSSNKQSSTRIANAGGKGGPAKGREGLSAIGTTTTSGSSSRDSTGRRTALRRDFLFNGQEEQEAREESRPATKAVAKDESSSLKPKKVAMAAQRAPASKIEAESSSFSFGNLIRILLIAGIIIGLLILFGGQILAIAKSGEK